MILLLTPLQLFKTLSDDTRLSIVLLLREMGELCVCDIGAALDAPQPKISRHLGMLRDAGLLRDRKEGKWVHYRLSPQMPAWAARVIEEAWEADRGAESRCQTHFGKRHRGRQVLLLIKILLIHICFNEYIRRTP